MKKVTISTPELLGKFKGVNKKAEALLLVESKKIFDEKCRLANIPLSRSAQKLQDAFFVAFALQYVRL